MANDTPRRPTYRQLRLLQFMREMPADWPLADWGGEPRAAREKAWRHGFWSAAKLVEQSDVYDDLGYRARGACLRDLKRLVALGELVKTGNGSGSAWSIGEAYRA